MTEHRNRSRLRALVLAWMAFLAVPAAHAATQIVVGSVTGVSGSTVRIPVQMTTADNPVGAQFDLIFDRRLTAEAPVGGTALSGHAVVSGDPTSGVKRVVLYDPANGLLKSGSLVEIPITLEPEVPEGLSTVTVTNVVLVTAQGSRIAAPAVSAGTLLAVSPPRFDHFMPMADGSMHLIISASVGRSYRLDVSEDLLRWNALGTHVATLGLIQVTDPNALTLNRRFYRLLTLP